ncbi:DUF4907 domain-containing protein [Aquimarina rhabdastrellae]
MKRKISYFLLGILLWNCNSSLQIEVYKKDQGYGYKILDHNKLMIKQQFIPAIPCNYSFVSEEEAYKVAQRVKSKLIKRENPSIKMEELKEMKITYNCNQIK